MHIYIYIYIYIYMHVLVCVTKNLLPLFSDCGQYLYSTCSCALRSEFIVQCQSFY